MLKCSVQVRCMSGHSIIIAEVALMPGFAENECPVISDAILRLKSQQQTADLSFG